MKARFAVLALALAMVGAVILVPANVSAQTFTNIDVTGTIPSIRGTFTGTLDVTKFAVQNNQIVALGTLSGTLVDRSHKVIGTVSDVAVALPVTIGQATCEILELTLGPLDLNLLGLMVHLDQVHLEITAQSGPGNLLGNLLCAIAGLLDSDGALQSIVQLLTQLIDILG